MFASSTLLTLCTVGAVISSIPAAASHPRAHHHVEVAAAAQPHYALSLSSNDSGAGILYMARDRNLAEVALEPPPKISVLQMEPGFVAVHSLRVQRDMMYFGPEIPQGDLPAVPNEAMLTTQVQSDHKFTFVQTPPSADLLAIMRERDLLRLWQPPQPNVGIGLTEGISMFATATMMAAHLPRQMRFLVDKNVHLGPVIFSDGGMGAGVGGHWM